MTNAEPFPTELRAIDSSRILARAEELSKERKLKRPDIKGALNEAFDRLAESVGDNFDDNRDPIVYYPSTQEDPYIFVVPVKQKVDDTKVTMTKAYEMSQDIKEEFENLVFETEYGLHPKDLAVDKQGHYLNNRVRVLWHGFNMYHRKLVQARMQQSREGALRPIGKYVLARVSVTGETVFIPSPKRYQTKAHALEEANRLATEEASGGWAIFRCLDVIVGDILNYETK